jgi:hypothetical protein
MNFHPITPINAEYKILTRILARRLHPLLAEHMEKHQFCGVPGNNIMDAVATVQDGIAKAEVTRTPYACYHWISKRHLTGYSTSNCSQYCSIMD